ncbi:MAG: ATP-dependent RNA helicase, partial [Treponema sp.]|nr:ATP-dependent RNA helicase [Treponema sp.]
LAEGLLSHAAMKAVRSQAVKAVREERAARDFTNQIKIAGAVFKLEVGKKKKKLAVLDWESLKRIRGEIPRDSAELYRNLKGVVTRGDLRLLDGEKLDLILRVAPLLDLDRDLERDWPRKRNFAVHEESSALVSALDHVLQVSRWKPKSPELGFVALFTDSAGSYWFRVSRGFHTALNESLASLEALVDDISASSGLEEKEKAAALYRKLSGFFS